MTNDPKRRYTGRQVHSDTRRRLLDGVIVPQPLDASDPRRTDDRYGGIWYQTSYTTPYLYLPPIETYHTGEAITPHMSIDVLVAVISPGGDHIVLTGWFNYYSFGWQYYGVPAAAFDDYTPYYWSYMPPALPLNWSIEDRSDHNVHN